MRTSLVGCLMPHGQFCTVETFVAGLVPYSTVSGDAGLFTIVSDDYGQALNIAAQNTGTIAAIRRTATKRNAKTVRAKFKLTSLAADDAGQVDFQNDALSTQVFFNPRREASADALRRARLDVGGETLFVTDASLDIDVWYEMLLSIVAGAGNTVATITRLSDSVLIKSTAFVSSHTPPEMSHLMFSADQGGLTSSTRYSDVGYCG